MSWACGTSWFGWAYQVYRIDATNVANIELVPNITYVSSTVWTYIVDDDIVINGWYFVNYSATELPEHLKSGGIPPDFRCSGNSATELPEHLKSGGIPPFFRVRP